MMQKVCFGEMDRDRTMNENWEEEELTKIEREQKKIERKRGKSPLRLNSDSQTHLSFLDPCSSPHFWTHDERTLFNLSHPRSRLVFFLSFSLSEIASSPSVCFSSFGESLSQRVSFCDSLSCGMQLTHPFPVSSFSLSLSLAFSLSFFPDDSLSLSPFLLLDLDRPSSA